VCISEGDTDTEEKYTNLKSTNVDIGKDNSVFLNDDFEPLRGMFLRLMYDFNAYTTTYAFW
jgi:hypothetical protein